MSYHDPVLLQDSVDALQIKPNGVYVDVTYGGGGHAKLILENLGETGRLIAFDQDLDASTQLVTDTKLTFVQHNFKMLKKFLRLHGEPQVDGILADLGVSSHQFNKAERGFSYRFDASLDMRMNQSDDKTAADILNTYTAEALQEMFSVFGEVRNSKTLAETIVAERKHRRIKTINDFLMILEPLIRGKKPRYLAQVFQALRIEVNQEMEVLKAFLTQALEVLRPGGRLVVISYHSLEDRYVKHFIKTGTFDGQFIKDFYGNISRPFKIITKKAVEPTSTEITINSRARSAKMRIAEKR